DHGNADDMLQKVKGSTEMQPRTAHSLNPVPFIIADPDGAYRLRKGRYGLANVATTVVTLLGHEPPAGWEPSMLEA
ncbi:MAG: 2,3-bisphosphoglycerate-independent phosphoglycerate mutase, partial [Bacillota bacterium]|nr:2,3-bisphosphoglycerate-independent phosphoglycerate mutase [Bacillota bacterium]